MTVPDQSLEAAPREDVSTFQGLNLALQRYWARQGCVMLQPYDMEMGAGMFHTATILRAFGPEPRHTDEYEMSLFMNKLKQHQRIAMVCPC